MTPTSVASELHVDQLDMKSTMKKSIPFSRNLDVRVREAIETARPEIVSATLYVGTVAIGTWPTPEREKVEHAMAQVVEALEAPMIRVLGEQYENNRDVMRKSLADSVPEISNAIMKAGTIAIGTWPTPESPQIDRELNRVTALVSDAVRRAWAGRERQLGSQ